MGDKLKPDVPGRGAWTRTGGLLPIRPGSTNRGGYYRAPIGSEPMVGSGWPTGRDRNHTGLVVHEAVKVLQRLLDVDPDGFLGPRTGKAIVAAQARHHLTADGIAGPATLRALLAPLVVAAAAEHRVPVDVLGGICVHESSLDPAAVGVSGWDTGVAQINLGAHTHVSIAQAVDPHYALDFTATDLREVYDRWVGKTKADPWSIATAHHNSPAAARTWALDPAGKPPFSQSREDNGYPQIADYVRMARTAWEGN
jgi:hypothetical protein